jgi:dipeptidase E
MQKMIVAIGGGEIRTRGTAAIDRETIRFSNKKNPKLLFIPTASSDSGRYCKRVQEYFGKFLKCRTDVLLLIKEQPSKERIRKKILSADIIYFGGGSTLQMMRVWRRLGVDKLIKSAYENGTVLSGISAGSICWFDSGHSDSMSFYNPRKWKYTIVRGLGLIRGIHCPHYNSKTRGIPRRKDCRCSHSRPFMEPMQEAKQMTTAQALVRLPTRLVNFPSPCESAVSPVSSRS